MKATIRSSHTHPTPPSRPPNIPQKHTKPTCLFIFFPVFSKYSSSLYSFLAYPVNCLDPSVCTSLKILLKSSPFEIWRAYFFRRDASSSAVRDEAEGGGGAGPEEAGEERPCCCCCLRLLFAEAEDPPPLES